MPLVSVLMSVYKEPLEWLKVSIDSILNQYFTDFEFIMVNDNPENKLLDDLLKVYVNRDSRIIIIKNKVNLGLTKSLNIGLTFCKGEFIARMDADDISEPNRLTEQYLFLSTNEIFGLCGSDYKIFNEKISFEKEIVLSKYNNDIKYSMMIKNVFCHPTLFFRRSILDEFEIKYNDKIIKSQDYDLVLNFLQVTEIQNINKNLLRYRISDSQISFINRYEQRFHFNTIRYNYFENILKTEWDTTIKEINLLKILKFKTSIFRKRVLIHMCLVYKKFNIFQFFVFLVLLPKIQELKSLIKFFAEKDEN